MKREYNYWGYEELRKMCYRCIDHEGRKKLAFSRQDEIRNTPRHKRRMIYTNVSLR